MARTAKIAISVDHEVLAAVEALRERTGETRSAAIARAIRFLTGSAEHQRQVEEYERAYRERPETNDEVALAREAARRAARALPWDGGAAGL